MATTKLKPTCGICNNPLPLAADIRAESKVVMLSAKVALSATYREHWKNYKNGVKLHQPLLDKEDKVRVGHLGNTHSAYCAKCSGQVLQAIKILKEQHA